MNTEPRQLTLFEKITVTFILMLFGLDTASLFSDHWLLYTIFIIVFDFAVWTYVGWYASRYGRKEYLQLKKWRIKVGDFLFYDLRLVCGGQPDIGDFQYKKCCELIDKLCKDKLVSIDNKKVLYDMLCEIWTKYGMGEGIYQIPIFIQEKWKKAQADDKLRQLKKDF